MRIVIKPPTGSTIPDKIPQRNAFLLLIPSPQRGIDTMAPSGKFWIAIPIASASAPMVLIPLPAIMAPAKATPTDIPSGIL